jgi:hypothetical protein
MYQTDSGQSYKAQAVKVSILLIFFIALSKTLYASSDFSSPEKVFDTLLEAILIRDMALYEECLGRPLNKEETEHVKMVDKTFMQVPSPLVVAIDNIRVLKKGFENIDIGKVFYIYSEQTWEYGDKRKEKKKLDLHFMKKGNRWIFIPIEGQSFLFQ